MTLVEKEQILQLAGFYGKLLTDKQQHIFALSYEQDWSLAEISQHLSISRNAVAISLKSTIQRFWHYEEVLHLAHNYDLRMALYDKILIDQDCNLVDKLKELENND